MSGEKVDGPAHYGGKDNPFEVIKIIEKLGFGFSRGNALKYLLRAGKKDPAAELEDMRKGLWYVERALATDEPLFAYPHANRPTGIAEIDYVDSALSMHRVPTGLLYEAIRALLRNWSTGDLGRVRDLLRLHIERTQP